MLLHINSYVGIGLGRQVFQVYGGDGSLANPWRLIALGDANTEVRIVDAETGSFSVFPMDTPAAPPAGFSPTGDKVKVTPNPHQYDTFPTPATGTLDLGTNFEAITWGWGACSLLGGVDAFALLYVVGTDGRPDRWFFAVPDEIEMVTKNPLFP